MTTLAAGWQFVSVPFLVLLRVSPFSPFFIPIKREWHGIQKYNGEGQQIDGSVAEYEERERERKKAAGREGKEEL